MRAWVLLSSGRSRRACIEINSQYLQYTIVLAGMAIAITAAYGPRLHVAGAGSFVGLRHFEQFVFRLDRIEALLQRAGGATTAAGIEQLDGRVELPQIGLAVRLGHLACVFLAKFVDLMPPGGPADHHDVVDLVEQLVHAARVSPMLRATWRTLVSGPPTPSRVSASEATCCEASMRICSRSGSTKSVKSSCAAGNARPLQRPARPLFDAIDQSRHDPHDEMVARAHAGHQRVGDVEHFEDGADAFLAVRLHRADFGKRGAGVDAQRRVPDHAGHVAQAGGEAADRFARQTVADHARPPLGPGHFGNRVRVEAGNVAVGRGAVGSVAALVGSEQIGGQFRGVGVGGPGEQLHQRGDLLASDALCCRQLAEQRSRRSPSDRPSSASGRRRSAGSAQ